MARAGGEFAAVLVVAVEDGEAIGWEGGDKFVVGLFDVFHGEKALEVLGANGGDDADPGVREIGDFLHFAALIGAHFSDEDLVLGLESD